MPYRKKLIEVAIPLGLINLASAYEKMPGIGPHPRGLHQWWARRPHGAARAVIFAQMVDDPSEWPDIFPSKGAQEKERRRLFTILEQLAKWENSSNATLMVEARNEIWESWRRTCAEQADHPRAHKLFDRFALPSFHDPFAGGGSIPLEASRLGMVAHASDLNPVAVLINKAMIEYPPRFAGRAPINLGANKGQQTYVKEWSGLRGLSEDVRYYGRLIRDEAEKRIGHLYSRLLVTEKMGEERPDLRRYVGRALPAIAYLWVRTVSSPNPAYSHTHVPLASTFLISSKAGKEAYIEPRICGDSYRFVVKKGSPPNKDDVKRGTKLARGANFRCLLSGSPIGPEHIKTQGKARLMRSRLMAVVAAGDRERVYLSPDESMELDALQAVPQWVPDVPLPDDPRNFWTLNYGLDRFSDLFSPRQLTVLGTLSDLISDLHGDVMKRAIAAGVPDDDVGLDNAGRGARAYADAVVLYLSLALDRCLDYNNTCTLWAPSNEKVMHLFGKQAIALSWDYPEASILNDVVGGFVPAVDFITDCLNTLPFEMPGVATQQDAAKSCAADGRVVSTDPPYYDNIGYADLSDFFYIWLRRPLSEVFPELFSTLTVPKIEELVASPYRHGGKQQADARFLDGMTRALKQIREHAHPAFPVTVYYAFKQSEATVDGSSFSTGWEVFLDAVIGAGFTVTGTWPLRSEQEYRMVSRGTNALASSIVLVCRPRAESAPVAARREFTNALKSELPGALLVLRRGNIAPVDLAQAAIGPGMAIFTRYSRVIDSSGNRLNVRDALSLINSALDEALAAQEADLDTHSRWAVSWFEQNGYGEGGYGAAETLSKAKNTSVDRLRSSGLVTSSRGKVRLLRPTELDSDWDPNSGESNIVWYVTHHLVRLLDSAGEVAAAAAVAMLGAKAEQTRELAYRLFSICERKKRPAEAATYNALVQSWPEITRRAMEVSSARPTQRGLFDDREG